MVKIKSAWIPYNANTRDINTGDCVKRSLSYAYGVDYDEISKQLNRTKRKMGRDAFNNYTVWVSFLNENGASKLSDSDCQGLTESEFSDKYSTGVYICLTGRTVKTPNHLVCIFNGDIIDSWDSTQYLVCQAWKVNNVSLDVEETSWDDIKEPILNYIQDYCKQVSNKHKQYFEISLAGDYKVDSTTRRLMFHLDTKEMPDSCDYRNYYTYEKRIMIKMNPRLSIEKNIESIQTQLKGRVYNWFYPIDKDIRDSIEMQTLEVNDHYRRYNKKVLLMLPEWCRKYVTYFSAPSAGEYSSYYLEMDPLPDDPDQSTVSFSTDGFSDLKYGLKIYKDTLRRLEF